MHTKTVLENHDELLHAFERNRAAGDDFPTCHGQLVIDTDNDTIKIEDDPNIEYEGRDVDAFLKKVFARIGIELHLT